MSSDAGLCVCSVCTEKHKPHRVVANHASNSRLPGSGRRPDTALPQCPLWYRPNSQPDFLGHCHRSPLYASSCSVSGRRKALTSTRPPSTRHFLCCAAVALAPQYSCDSSEMGGMRVSTATASKQTSTQHSPWVTLTTLYGSPTLLGDLNGEYEFENQPSASYRRGVGTQT